MFSSRSLVVVGFGGVTSPLVLGYSADSNVDIKLIENNARVGTEVAREMAKLQSESGQEQHASMSAYMPAVSSDSIAQAQPQPELRQDNAKDGNGKGSSPSPTTKTTTTTEASPVRVQVFGSAAIDITTRPNIPLQPGTTTPGTIRLTPGGVGRNIAEATQNLMETGAVQLVSTIGASGSRSSSASDTDPETETETDMIKSISGVDVDGFGKVLMLEMGSSGLRTDGLEVKVGERTAGCTLSLGMEGDLNDGVADMTIIESLSPEAVSVLSRIPTPIPLPASLPLPLPLVFSPWSCL